MSVWIVDYGMGNLASIVNAIKVLGFFPMVMTTPDDSLASVTHIILPGQGAFKEGMAALERSGWKTVLHEYAVVQKRPLLGICLGMQLLAECSEEGGMTSGLGFIPGVVRKLCVQSPRERLPHVGWNAVYATTNASLWWHDLTEGSDFYFVHSYHFQTSSSWALGMTEYGEKFISMVGNENILGVQFHPEKSAHPGRQLLKNFLEKSTISQRLC